MPGVSREQVAKAREVDLLSYLMANEPHNLRKSGSEYSLRDHDSLKISNGKWHWHSRGFGGRTALDYLLKVRGMGFVAAVETLSGERAAVVPSCVESPRQAFLLPQKAANNDRVMAYLQSRGISKELIDRCIKAGIIYESMPYHNAIFVGKNSDGDPKFACARGTFSNFKRDVAGSDKRFSFALFPENERASNKLAVFESPIDVLSHDELSGEDCHRLSLAGTAPTALLHFLGEAHSRGHPRIDHVSLCLDNDPAGHAAAENIKSILANDSRFAHIAITRDLPTVGKDFNENLLSMRKQLNSPEKGRQHDDGLSL